MIPTIEQIVEDLLSGAITKQQAVTWLHQHAEGAANADRDMFAGLAMQAILPLDTDNGRYRNPQTLERAAFTAYAAADAMLKARGE